jgi:tetratricopeptide (TPR) repeat protein
MAYGNRGAAYGGKGDYDQAIADCTRAIRLDPNYADAYSNRGAAYVIKGNYGRAIADWEAALRINPNNAQARQNIEIVRQKRGY